jgi:hypothetical protein
MDCYGFLPPSDESESESDAEKFFKRRESVKGYAITDADMEQLSRLVGMWKQLTKPYLSGIENLPDPVSDRQSKLNIP